MHSHDWDARYEAVEMLWGVEPNRWVARELADLPPGRALDLAAGEGRNSIWLAARGWQVTAVDFAAVALDRGRRLAAAQPDRVADRIDWIDADVTAYRPTPEGYDLVLISYLQLPAADRRAVLGHAADALAPGGTLLVVGHDTANLTDGTGGPQDVRVLFTAQDVIADLAGRGLTALRAERVHRPVAGAARDAIDALARLRRPAAGS